MYKFFSTLLLGLSVSSYTAAYESPIGIPDPGSPSYGWGQNHPIDTQAPSRPSNWNSERAGFYYVDPSHSNATNTNNTYGYPGKPRASIPREVAPGSYVELNGDHGTAQYQVEFKCTAQAPCWLKGTPGSNSLVSSGYLRIVDASYLFVDGLNFDGGTNGAISIIGNSHHIAIRNSRVTNRLQPNGAGAGIGVTPGIGKLVENIVLYGNYLHTLGDWTVDRDLDFHGFGIDMWGRDSTAELRNVWILNNYCKHLSGDCVQVNAGNWTDSQKYLHHVYIGHNESEQNRQSGFWIKQASDVIISQNKSHGSAGNGSANAGSAAGMQYPKDNVWFIFNELYDSVYGIRQSDTSTAGDIYIIGNLIYNIRPKSPNYDPSNAWAEGTAIALWHGNSNRYIIDNTIHGVNDGVNAIYDGYVELQGNIISQIGKNSGNHFFTFSHPARSNNVVMDRNLFINDTQSYYAWWDNVGRISSLDHVKDLSKQCTNCTYLKGDSSNLFVNTSVDPDRKNYNIRSDAPNIGTNRKHAAYDIFQQRYGINIFVDFYGNPRSQQGALGAIENATFQSPPEKMSTPSFEVLD